MTAAGVQDDGVLLLDPEPEPVLEETKGLILSPPFALAMLQSNDEASSCMLRLAEASSVFKASPDL